MNSSKAALNLRITNLLAKTILLTLFDSSDINYKWRVDNDVSFGHYLLFVKIFKKSK